MEEDVRAAAIRRDEAEATLGIEELHGAVERAFREGRCSFRKPISCHLYPIRVVRFSNGTLGLNYHRWEVCRPAVECGRRLGIPVYKALREPIVRRFSEEFYRALEAAEEFLREQERRP